MNDNLFKRLLIAALIPSVLFLSGCPEDDTSDDSDDTDPYSSDSADDTEYGTEPNGSDSDTQPDDSGQDSGLDTATDTTDPGPATPVVVNSANTATYNLADGQQQNFYFDAEAGQVYSIEGLSGISLGYVSTAANVSASNYQYVTDATTGTVAFVAPAAARYYIAVVVSGGGASGSFQVADGGQLLPLGATSVTLESPTGDNNWFFHFPITAGTGYRVQIEGPATPQIGLAVSPRAERSSNGQFSYPNWGVGTNLPLNDTIDAASVNLSYSGYYYLYVNVHETMSLTITISQQ